MKKQPLSLLAAITCIFCTFTLGFFFGRNQNQDTVFLSSLPREPRHTAALETIPISEPLEVAFPVNINTAGVDELTALPGVGETLAKRILSFREVNGAFDAPEELLNVEGIGSGKLEAILDYITTGE